MMGPLIRARDPLDRFRVYPLCCNQPKVRSGENTTGERLSGFTSRTKVSTANRQRRTMEHQIIADRLNNCISRQPEDAIAGFGQSVQFLRKTGA
jgi:hypothetical protein